MANMKKYNTMGFNSEQLNEICQGLEEGVDVSIYADLKFDGGQMHEIRWGLNRRLDVSIYANPKYDWGQMNEIRFGLENGIDVSDYADPKFNRNQMQQIRWGLEKGVDVSCYADEKFSSKQMNFMLFSLLRGVDVSKILDASLSCEEMQEIINKKVPTVEQFLKNYNISNDGKKAIFYKAVHKLNDVTFYSDYDHSFIYKTGETVVEPNIDRDVETKCSCGIHVSSLVWAKQFANSWNDSSFIEVEVDVDDIVLPIYTDGQVRVSHAKVLREVF